MLNFLNRFMATSVFPDAVGPNKKIILFFGTLLIVSRELLRMFHPF